MFAFLLNDLQGRISLYLSFDTRCHSLGHPLSVSGRVLYHLQFIRSLHCQTLFRAYCLSPGQCYIVDALVPRSNKLVHALYLKLKILLVRLLYS